MMCAHVMVKQHRTIGVMGHPRNLLSCP